MVLLLVGALPRACARAWAAARGHRRRAPRRLRRRHQTGQLPLPRRRRSSRRCCAPLARGLPSASLSFPRADVARLEGAGSAAEDVHAAGAPPCRRVASVFDRIDASRLGLAADNMSGLREYFWSARLLQWAPLAGTVAVARRSLPAAGLLAGWLFAFVLVKGSAPVATVDSGSFFRLLMPASRPSCSSSPPSRCSSRRSSGASESESRRPRRLRCAAVSSSCLPSRSRSRSPPRRWRARSRAPSARSSSTRSWRQSAAPSYGSGSSARATGSA